MDRRIRGIEGLRALAATIIVVLHTWEWTVLHHGHDLQAGTLTLLVLPQIRSGVTLFFVLSGFLLFRPFAAAAIRSTRAPSLRRYAQSRTLRIMPAYLVVLFATTFVLGAGVLGFHHGNPVTGTPSAAHLLAAALLVHGYVPGWVATGLVPSWSLVAEAGFYLLLPLLGLAALALAGRGSTRAARVRRVLVVVAGLLGAGIAARVGISALGGSELDINNGPTSVLTHSLGGTTDLFAWGMLVAVARVEWEDGRLQFPVPLRRRAAVGAIAVVPVVALLPIVGIIPFVAYDAVVAALCALLLALVVIPKPGAERPTRLVRSLEARPVVAVGVVSFSVFLWNYQLIMLAAEHGLLLAGGPAAVPLNLAIIAVPVAIAAAATYRFVEAPAMRLRRRGPSLAAASQHEPVARPAAVEQAA